MCTISHETADLVTFTEEIIIGKFQFLCSENEKTSDMCEYQCPGITKLTYTSFVIYMFIPQSTSLDLLATASQWKCSQPAFTFSRLTIKTLEQGVKYVHVAYCSHVAGFCLKRNAMT